MRNFAVASMLLVLGACHQSSAGGAARDASVRDRGVELAQRDLRVLPLGDGGGELRDGAATGPRDALADQRAPVSDAGARTDAGAADGGPVLCGHPVVLARFAACRAAGDAATCNQEGGTWTAVGAASTFTCVCPTGQESCACHRSTDCLNGMCLGSLVSGCAQATVGTCAEQAPLLDCLCRVGLPGQDGGVALCNF